MNTAQMTEDSGDMTEFMRLMHDRFRRAHDAEQEEARKAVEDIKFCDLPGEQWTDEQKRKRRQKPCYEFNRIRQAVKQVVGDQRQNKPSVKVRAVDSDTDPKAADVMQGLIRNIESVSNADVAYDTAFEFAVKGGKGVWRIVTDYACEDAFDLDILIKEVRNPFTVLFDPAANEWDKRDGAFAFVTETISRTEFKAKYPDKAENDFDGTSYGTRREMWNNEDLVRIAEYWTREEIQVPIMKLTNGAVVEATEQNMMTAAMAGIQMVSQRMAKTYKVQSYIVSGSDVLSGPHPWAGKYIPIVPVWGDCINVEGHQYWQGMVRQAKDAQRLYNFNRTMTIEAAAKAPKAPFLATPKQIEGFEKYWQASNVEDFPVLFYNPDPQAGGMPQRNPGPDVPAAFLSLSQIDAEDIKATTGIYDAALGARSNETSGRAILARQREGDVANFNYSDNLARAIRFTGEILVDLIPKIYDSERIVRVIGEDGAQKFAVLNAPTDGVVEGPDKTVYLPDITMGKYDVTVSSGPSYSTQRQETAEAMLQLANSGGAFGPIAAYSAIKNLDIPNAQEEVGAMRRVLVKEGLLDPDEKDQPPPPNPMQEAQAQMQMAAAQAELEGQQLDNAKKQQELQAEGLKLSPELQKMIADVVNAQLDAALKQQKLANPDSGRMPVQ